jgi:hypothetical protein
MCDLACATFNEFKTHSTQHLDGRRLHKTRGHGGTGSLVNRKLDVCVCVCAARRALEGIGRGHRKLHGVRPKTRFVSAEFFSYTVLQHVIFVLHIGEQFRVFYHVNYCSSVHLFMQIEEINNIYKEHDYMSDSY